MGLLDSLLQEVPPSELKINDKGSVD